MANRTKFILNTSAEYFNATTSRDESSKIDEFLKNDEITILGATQNNGKIIFYHKIPSDENCLLFYKIPQVGITSSGIKLNTNDIGSLGMLTLEGGMVKSMYNSVSRIFSPHVGSKRNEYTPEIAGLIENLQVSLNETLGLPQTGITNIQDEISFWDQKSINSPTKSDREQAQSFASVLGKLNKQISQIDQNSITTIEEFLDSAHNNLDEIWRLPYHYPQNRMEDLMDIICNFIIDICVENMLTENIWNLNSYHVNNLMSQSVDLVDSWMQLCDSLTRLFWPNYSQYPWIGKPHIPKRARLFKERLGEIKNIKNLYKQIVTLLNSEDIKNMMTFNSLFKMINIFDISSMGQMKWNKALNQFEQILQPIDDRIAIAIKIQLQNHLNNPRQVIFIFSKYETLIQRPTVLELLTVEREQFLQSLNLLVQDLRKAMNVTNMEPDTGHLSTICNECRWLTVVQYQITEIEKVSHLISGREGFDKINQNVQELKEETEALLRTNFEIWSEQNLTAIKSGDLRLREDQPVVKFEREGRQLMQVTFNPKLVTFCQDVREFENLGYRVPIELRSVAEHTSKFMSYARRLQQISTFHNTIGDRMIPCQRPIMLKNAIELSNLVKSESVAWNDKESVKRYVTTLQTAVSKLSMDNNLLVSYHEQAKRTVVKLMNTDLLSQGQIWKDEMRHLRELVANLERQGYTKLDAFNLHWDHQLYKVLEYQYILGLIDMNNKLPDIRIDIVFRQRQLQFRPPEEEIRSKYFTQLKRFIERPLGFRGLSENSSELFKTMVERNRHHFGPLFRKAEDLFKRLDELKNLWIPWVALGCVDIDELCAIHLNKWEDWDTNFKACKYFSQQIAKLQNSDETIDCFIINFLPLRSDIEFINRRYWEALASTLKVSILNDISIIQEFLQTSMQFLQNVPVDEASIADSSTRYEKIVAYIPKITETLQIVKGKDTCLAGWCKERVSALTGILNQWEKLQPLIVNHSVILQRQIDIMKDHAKSQIHNLTNDIEKFMLRWESTISELENSDCNNLDLFKERRENWKIIKEKMEKLKEDCIKYNLVFPEEALEIFKESEEKILSQSKQWEIYDDFLIEFEKILNEEWTIYRRRPYILTEFLSKWETSVTSSLDMPSSRIRYNVQHCQDILPILQYLQSDALTERHWARIFQLLNMSPKPFHTITLKDVLVDTILLEQASNEIQNLVRKAFSEQIVRQALGELDQWAVTATFKLINHNDSLGNQINLIKDYQEILNKIGDNQSLLQSAKNSAAFDSFSDQAELWESRLNNLDGLLSSLSQSQRKWIYLEPVFETGTLKSEEAIFKRLDKDFRYIMGEIHNDARVLSMIKINNISTIIRSLENQLSRCQNTLMSYIMDKRGLFPRFYFLGDDDLLELLGQATKEDIIQKHIKKLFPGIQYLGMSNKNNTNIIEDIRSSEGDVIRLKESITITNSIEVWLNQLISSIQTTLKDQIFQCSQSKSIDESVLAKYPIQVLCTVRAIIFTKQTEKGITSMSLPSLLKSMKDEVLKFTELKNKLKNSLIQLKCKSLLIDLVHYGNIIELLIKENVTNLMDWQWLQQVKFYLEKDNEVKVKMVYAEFKYSYEFLGNSNKLVHTSLTHRCYLTLTQAMHMGLGGNPFGPAGTGKTECVKALGAMMGRLVLVFNCDENVDTEAMSLILTGLAMCGAWGCFDEFNRLQESTLSAISMLIQPIQSALKDKKDNVQILDKSVKINQHCGIFVTLNPAGEEYGGRQQLPGNIQALFRPIVMQQPEPKEISRILLFVEGFKNANEIGDRIVELFDLNIKVLSHQNHYDWGLRELTTLLIACGRERHSHHNIESLHAELKIVVQVLRANTMSKLNSIDAKRFEMLLKNVFPEVETEQKYRTELWKHIQDSFMSLNLYANDRQIEKTVQLYEQLTKRMGVVVVGPPQSGKTTIISLLRKALVTSGKTIRTYTISPKSMNRIELLGKLDSDTRQWTDGVLTSIAVNVNTEPLETSWIICDGDVDPEWIESLNSVLDDNRLLTLPSGWRIQFGSNVNFIFETHNLLHASPATISRMGIINLSNQDLPEKIIIELFLEKEEYGEINRSYIDQFVTKSILQLKTDFQNQLFDMKLCIIKSILNNISCVQTKEEFCVKLVKSLLGFIVPENHNNFANKIYEQFDVYLADPSRAELTYYNQNRFSIDYYQSNNPVHFSEHELIQTSHIKFSLDIVKSFLKTENPFLIVGPSGSGKTLLLQQAISEFSGYNLVTINCTKQLTPNYILSILKQNSIIVSGLRGREYKPQQIKNVMFFKNIDLCNVDAWGTSDVIELLLQLIQRHGFYSENLKLIKVTGLQICGSITNLTTSIEKLSPRFLAVNTYLQMKYPIEEDMRSIIQNNIEPILQNYKTPPKLQIIVENLMKFYKEVHETFSADRRIHYNFTPKMFIKMIEYLKNYSEEYFIEALITEINSSFRNRLVSIVEFEEFIHIVNRNMRSLLNNFKDEIYFVSKSTQNVKFSCISTTEWTESVKKSITICSAETFQIEGPMTEELLNQCSIMSRIFSRPNTHLILTSRPGCRAIDSLYIAATMLSAKVYIPQGIKNYTILEFINDLKMAMQSSALEDQNTIFLIDQCWITYLPEILKPIEAIFEGILDLFGEDLESVASPLKSSAQLEGFSDSLANYFLNRVKKNLHLVLSFDSLSGNLDVIFENYPALYRNTEQMWILNTSAETLHSLPKKCIDLYTNGKNDVEIPSYFSKVVISEYKEKPPRLFYQLIQSYFHIYNAFSKETTEKIEKLRIGVEKLANAHKIVDELKTTAIGQEEKLAEKRKLANDALKMISATMRNANDQKSDMLELKRKTQENSIKLKERQQAIAKELSEVEPILQEASAAVGQIKTEALSEIRSLRAPPEAIRDILEGVLRLMGTRDTSWNSMKSFLAKRGVKEDIKSLDPSRISVENCEAVEKLLETKADSFDLRNAKRASVAAAPLATWVIANVKYCKVIQSIKPLEQEQKKLQRNLSAAESEIQSLMTGLDDVDARVKELSQQLNNYTQEAAVLEIKLEKARETLSSAEILVEKLSSEYQTWSKQLEQYHQEHKTLDIKSFWIALSINYLSDELYDKRKKSIETLASNLQHIQYKTITDYLITEQDQVIWEGMGLSKDAQSIENAAILTKTIELPFGSFPTPLILDPTETAFKWLSGYLASKEKSFEVITQNSDKISYTIELAVRFGKILIVNDSEEIIPPLLQLILARLYSKFNKKILQVGNKLIDLHDDFKIILFTKLNKINIPPELNAYITNIHFTITATGLTDQLMSTMLILRQPELQERRINLLQNEGKLLRERNDLENKLLQELTNAQGDILKNYKLLTTLNEVKESEKNIDQSLKESANIKKSILQEYNPYKKFCSNAANFFIGLSKNYELSVTAFIKLYGDALKYCGDIEDQKIFKYLIQIIYQYMCRSITKDNYLTLGLAICKNAFPDEISQIEWELLVTNFISNDVINNKQKSEQPEWIKKEHISKIHVLNSKLHAFYKNLQLENEDYWQNYLDSKKYMEIALPISGFQKILIAQIFRPDFMLNTMNQLVTTLLGIKPEAITQATVEQLSDESSNNRPVLIITSPGNDPSIEIKDYATNKFGKQNYIEISIGRGKQTDILDKIKKAAESDQWVCVKNIHLVPQFISKIDRELMYIKSTEKFRLWLICDSTKDFPETVLYRYVRILYESPNGIKNKIYRLMQQWNASLLGEKLPNNVRTMKLHIVFFILNSILQERRKYIPQGWSKFYEFSDSDVRSGFEILKWFDKEFNNNLSKIDWIILRRLFDVIAYGGRINNAYDFEILQKHLEEFFNDTVLTNGWSPLRLNILIPNSNKLQDYYDALLKFSDTDTPDELGLSPSSHIFRHITFSKNILQSLRKKDEQKEDENLEKRMKHLLGFWKKIAVKTTILETYNQIQNDEASTPWQDFLMSEMKISVKLYTEVHGTLARVHASIKRIKSNKLLNDSVISKLCDNQIPGNWKTIWSGPKTTFEYLKAVVIRTAETEKRYKSDLHLEFCEYLDLGTIFNISTFFAALKLTISNRSGKSTCDLILSSSVLKINNQVVVQIAPLSIDGGTFVKGKLCIFDKSENGVKLSPEFFITYIDKEEHNVIKNDDKCYVNLPFYSTINRDLNICNLLVPSLEESNTVLLSGSALHITENIN